MPVKGTRPGPINVSDPTSPARDPSSPTSRSPQKSVEDILKEKREAQEALLRVASELSSALLSLGIDSANPKPGQTGSKVRLPLSYFDNLDLERDTPEGWVTASRRAYGKRPNAILCMPDGGAEGGGSWVPGRVTGYDAQSGLFACAPAGMDGKVLEDQATSLPRLSVLFLSEKPGEFAERVALAHKARDECEGALLLSFYIKNMPTADVRTLNEMQVASLLQRTLTTNRLKSSDIDPNQLIDEVKLDYAHSVNGMLLREGLQRPPLKDKFASASLLPPPPPPVPELGVIEIPDNQYEITNYSFNSISSLVMPEVVMALCATKTECLQLEKISLFNLEQRTFRLEDFEQLQTQHTIRTLQFLRESWQPNIKKVVQSSLREVEPERWDAPCPPPSAFPDDDEDPFAPSSPSGPIGPSADDMLAASLVAAGGPAPEGMEIEEYERPDTRSFRLMRQVNLNMADAVRRMTQESMRSYVTFLIEAFERRTKLTDALMLPYIPLFELDITCDNGELNFSDMPALFVEVGVKLLDEAIAAVGEVLEVDLFDKSVSVPMTLHPLSTVDPEEPEVLDLREKLHAAITASLEPLEKYLEELRIHEEILQRDEGEYVRAFEESGGEENKKTLEQLKVCTRGTARHTASIIAISHTHTNTLSHPTSLPTHTTTTGKGRRAERGQGQDRGRATL